MTALTVKFFPLGAVAFSIFAWAFPESLSKLGFLIVPILGFIMLGMGMTLSVRDFFNAVKNPLPVIIGIILQFTLMPFLAYLTGKLLNLAPEQFSGLVMVGCVAGGTASNVITCIAGGNVALSITMTACSTVAGIFLTPLLSSLYLGASVDVPAVEMFKSILLVVALPVGCGLIINRTLHKYDSLIRKISPVFSVIAIIFVIGIIVSLNAQHITVSGPIVTLAVIIHNTAGLAAGYFAARLFKLDRKTAVTIAIEVGMQNSGLAAALSKQFFGAASALPGAVFSIWHNISGALFSAIFRNRIK